MPKKEVFNLTIDVGANISQAQTAAKSLQQAFSKINLSDNLRGNLDKTFANLEKELNSLSTLTSKPFTSMKDIQKAEKSYDKINDLMAELVAQSKSIEGADLSKFIPADALNKLKSFNTQLEQVRKNAQALESQKISIGKDLENARKKGNDLKDEIDQVTAKLQQAESSSDKSKSMQNRIEGYKVTLAGLNVELTQNTQKQKELNDELKKLENVKPEGLQQLRESLKEFTGDSLRQIPRTFESLQNYINNLQTDEIEKIRKNVKNLGPEAQRLAEAFGIVPQKIRETADEGQRLSETAAEVERLSNQVKQFFSIGNAIQLFKRTIRDAMNTVKELDKAMTETATVTDFSISDMWEQLPRYTEEANKLGTSINSLYKATTLYYQQGLNTNEAMALGIETIKMARVASMDAAQATDLMTAALRGFNMELNETSAIRVNDVYSELAAVTAADTDEIGIAISKTASIAHSANMEFETTAAFLSQIIETTREAPETAGTAMKTIVARFSEVKKLYSEGQITGTDEEGEVVNVNKIQEALRTVGIDMSKFFTGKEGLDQILLRLAEKWDTLDVVTQRYIATQAAGSRQQSRFLAMMSDYDRTLELVNAAYDSAGSGQRQFEKTLDSMEAKLAELKNAWDQFIMGIANNEILKAGVDTLTKILSIINDIISAVSGNNGLVKSILSLGASFLALKGGRKLLQQNLLGPLVKTFTGKEIEKPIKESGIIIGSKLGTSIGEGLNKTSKNIKGTFSTFFSKEGWQGIFKNPNKNFQPLFGDIQNTGAEDIHKAMKNMGMSDGEKHEIFTIWKTEGKEAAIGALEEYHKKQEQVEEKNKQWEKSCQQVGSAIMGIGAAVTLVGGFISKENEEAGKIVSIIGMVITGIGGIISIIPGLVAGIQAINTAMDANPVGAVIAAIALAISALVILINLIETPEKKLKKLQEEAKKSAEEAQKAQQAYDDLLSDKNDYTELQDKIKALTKGTKEWEEAVGDLNNKVLELSQTYKGLEYSYNEDGVLAVTNWEKVEEEQKKKRDETLYKAMQDNIAVSQQEYEITLGKQKYIDKGTGKEFTRDQIKERFDPNGYMSDEQFETYLEVNYTAIVSSDITEAKKQVEKDRNNLLLAFVPDKAIEANIANEYAEFINSILGAAEKAVEDYDKDELAKLLTENLDFFNSLKIDEEGKGKDLFNLLTGHFENIQTDEEITFDFNEQELKDKFNFTDEQIEKIKTKVEELNDLNKKSFNNLKRNLGTYLTDRSQYGPDQDSYRKDADKNAQDFINNVGRDTATKLADKMDSMAPEAAQNYFNVWKKIFEGGNEELAKSLLEFDVTDFTSLTNLTDYMREQGLDEDLAEEYWRAMVNGAEEFTITYGQIASWSESIRNNMKETMELIDRLENGKLSAEDLKTLQNAGLDTSNRLLTPDGYKVYGIDSQEARRALNQQNAEKAQVDLDTLKSFDPTKIRMGDRQAVEEAEKLLNLTRQKGETDEEYAKRIKETWEENLRIAEETNDYAQAGVYTADEMAARGGSAQQIRYSAMQEASDAGLDVDELLTYSEKLQELYGIEQSMADRIALDNMKMNASIKELADNWDEWGEALKDPSTGEYAVTLSKLQKNMRQLLGIDADLSASFLTNADNMELMKKAAEGDADAIDALRKEATKELALGVDFDKDGIDTVEQNLLNALDGFDPNIKIGTSLDEAGLTSAFQALLDSGKMTADEINAALEGIGFEPEITYEPISVNGGNEQTIRSMGGYYLPDGTFQPVSTEETVTSEMLNKAYVPVINGKKTEYKGGGSTAVNPSNKSKGGKKGGGGGGSKKQNNWKNPYDKYYNLTEKINEALRTREKIERDYDRILKRRERTVAELLANSQAEIGNLQKEIQYQKQLQAGRREQIQNVAGERYDNGDQITTFEKMGVTKYAGYNFDTQTIEIDWAAIEAVRDEELGKAIEAYVSRLEELQGQFEDTQNTIEEMEDNIWEINQRGKEEYLSFEQRVLDALIAADQKLIDDLSDKFESINEANSNILNSMQEQIDLERQIRDNTKTEDDIAQKEARLAYLRRDTSGANATEIMKLEQELADARQNYTDTLIDQGLQKLSDENQRAAEQRQMQIDIMQSMHDWMVQSGGFNDKAEELINEAAAAGEVTEAIKTLLQTNDGWQSMTKFAGEKWMTDLANEYKAAMEGMSNFKVDEAKTKNTSAKNALAVTDANGKNQQSVWFDSNKNRWVDSKGNLYDIYYDPTANNGQGGYKYSNKSAAQDENAWLKEYLDSIAGSIGNLGNSSSSSGSSSSGGSGGSGGGGGQTQYYKGQVKDASGKVILWTGTMLRTSIKQAKQDAQNEIDAQKKKYKNWYETLGTSDPQYWYYKNSYDSWNKATKTYYKFATGGLANFTGPAWLDGTKAHPELVLNARDTENFIQLKDVLSGMGSLDKLQNGGDNYYNFDIKVDQLASDYDVDKLIGKIKNEIDKDARYRNVNSINFIR